MVGNFYMNIGEQYVTQLDCTATRRTRSSSVYQTHGSQEHKEPNLSKLNTPHILIRNIKTFRTLCTPCPSLNTQSQRSFWEHRCGKTQTCKVEWAFLFHPDNVSVRCVQNQDTLLSKQLMANSILHADDCLHSGRWIVLVQWPSHNDQSDGSS